MAEVLPETTKTIVTLLGGQKVLHQKINEPRDLQRLLRSGLPHRSFEILVEKTNLQQGRVAGVLGFALRTLARRKRKRLTAVESDRVYRLARIAALAINVLGSHEKACRWLTKENRALAGEAPLSLLDTEIGARQVEAVLGRIEHGVFS